MKNETPRSDGFRYFLIISVLVHIILVLLAPHIMIEPSVSENLKEEQNTVWLEDLQKNSQQLADIAPPEKEEKPDHADYKGMYDSKVQEETVAPSNPGRVGQGGLSLNPKAKSESSAAPEAEKKESENPVAEKKNSNPDDLSMSEKTKKPDKASSASMVAQKAALGEGLSQDFFPDVKMGSRTYLNVDRFPQASYFVRLKKMFRMTWNPVPALTPYRYQITQGQVSVVVGVSVDPKGRLAHLTVLKSSGIPSYDQEALRTIRASSPFSAPPSELLDESRQISMAWTFTLMM